MRNVVGWLGHRTGSDLSPVRGAAARDARRTTRQPGQPVSFVESPRIAYSDDPDNVQCDQHEYPISANIPYEAAQIVLSSTVRPQYAVHSSTVETSLLGPHVGEWLVRPDHGPRMPPLPLLRHGCPPQ